MTKSYQFPRPPPPHPKKWDSYLLPCHNFLSSLYHKQSCVQISKSLSLPSHHFPLHPLLNLLPLLCLPPTSFILLFFYPTKNVLKIYIFLSLKGHMSIFQNLFTFPQFYRTDFYIWKNTPVNSHGYWWLTSSKWIVACLTDLSLMNCREITQSG